MIIIRLDRVLADRKMRLNDLAAQVGISNVNLSYLKIIKELEEGESYHQGYTKERQQMIPGAAVSRPCRIR